MKLHSLQIRLKGKVLDPLDDYIQELDIADEFSRLARSLGLEGDLYTYAGLWATQPVYDDHSLLSKDFLANELHLDLLCDSRRPVPFAAIFLCLGETLKRIATCEITEVLVECWPSSDRTRTKKRSVNTNLQFFSGMSFRANQLPVAQCSTLHYVLRDKRDAVVSAGEVPLPLTRCSLPELALAFSGLWSQWEGSLRHVRTIEIKAN